MLMSVNPFLRDSHPKTILVCYNEQTGAINLLKFCVYLAFHANEAQNNFSCAATQLFWSSDDSTFQHSPYNNDEGKGNVAKHPEKKT